MHPRPNGALCALLMSVGLMTAGGSAAYSGGAEPLAVVDVQTYVQPGRLIAVDGPRRLNLLCMGTGSPVVLLESGAGGGAIAWRRVQAEIAKFTRVCAYDRAGYGFSDPISRPSDAKNTVADLHKMLNGAGVRAPIILVGHSVGGLYAELFAASYPRQVAGMVLVDPTGLDDFRLVTEIITDDERVRQREAFLNRSASYARCLDRARQGLAVGPAGSECAPGSTGDAVLDNELRRQFGQAKYVEAFQSEMANFYPNNHPDGVESVITGQVRSHPLLLGDKPLTLLMTPGRVPPGERGERLRAGSTAAAQRLVAASTRGKLVTVASGHYIQDEHPDLVIGTVREVVESVRASQSH